MSDAKTAALRALAYGLMQDRLKAGDDLNRADLKREMTVGATEPVWGDLNGQPIELGSVQHKRGTKGGTEASVTNQDAFKAWVKTHYPDNITTRTVTVSEVSPWLVALLLKEAADNGEAVDINGEAIPGVTVTEKVAGKPTLAVTRVKTIKAQAALIDLVFAQGIEGFRSLLAVEPANGETE